MGTVLRASSVDGVAPRDSSAAKALPRVMRAALLALGFTAPARTSSCLSKGVASLMGSPAPISRHHQSIAWQVRAVECEGRKPLRPNPDEPLHALFICSCCSCNVHTVPLANTRLWKVLHGQASVLMMSSKC